MELQDLLELAHFLTRLKLVPSAGEGDPMMEGDRARGVPLAQKLSMPALARIWQMLLKGLGEVQIAPSPLQAAEMVLVRLAYVADLPPPADLIKVLSEGREPSAMPRGGASVAGGVSAGVSAMTRSVAAAEPVVQAAPRMQLAVQQATEPESPEPQAALAALPAEPPRPQNFREVVSLFDLHREAVLRSHLWSHCHLVNFEPGRIELRLTEAAPRDLPNRLGQLLSGWTQMRWVVSVSSAPGEPSLREQADRHARDIRSEAEEHPMVRAVLEVFPGATIEAVRELSPLEPSAAGAGGEEAAADDSADGEDVV
jgi:DNA polymerase-3 subunit gamma/tau